MEEEYLMRLRYASLQTLNRLALTLGLLTLLWAAPRAAVRAEAPANLARLTILHTNDQHAHLLPDREGRGGAANIAALFRQVRREQPATLVLDAGDMTQGTPVSTIYNGLPIFEVLNAMGYDAATLGNHEFDNGPQYPARFAAAARFPLISSNLLLDGHPLTGIPSRVIQVGALRVGLLGLTTNYSSIEEQGVRILTPEEALKRHLPALRRQADLVVVLSHLGLEEDNRLAGAVAGIDVIVGGHSHTPLPSPLRVGQTLIVQAGFHGRWVGRLDLTYDRRQHKLTAYNGRLLAVPVAGLAPDPATQRVVASWEDKVARQVDVTIGQSARPLNEQELRRAIERIWRDAYKTDFAYQNDGGVRDTLAAGPLRVRDIYNILPFNNTLVIVELERRQVVQYASEPSFAQDKPLYTMITNSYVAQEMIKRFKLPERRLRRLDVSWRQPVLDYVRLHHTLAVPARAIPAPARPASGQTTPRSKIRNKA